MTLSVSTIPPGAPFVDTLAAGILARHGGDPLDLAKVTVLLPTRRACLALRDAFLRRSGGTALILPRITPLGDVDPDEIEAAADVGAVGDADAAVPPAISELSRRLLLARLILAWGGESDMRADQAVRLAGELAALLDQVQTARLSFDALDGLVPDDYAEHWQHTLDFLKIVTAEWPALLAERGLIDPAVRRDTMLGRLAERWLAAPPADPVIAAGSTGSIPATADLLAVIANLPAGEVVLPGLERDADEASWDAIDESHPQYGLKRLLGHIGIDRDRVADWPLCDDIAASHPARAALIAAALRPAETTDAWRDMPAPPDAAFDGLERIDCPGAREETGVIALKLREALEHDGRTAALVTRDRGLARRVAAELGRWGVALDDSGGQPLADTAPGSFLRLVAELVAARATPLALLAALKHPLAAGGRAPGRFRARVRALERKVLRGPRPEAGFTGVARALAAAKAPPGLRDFFDAIATAAAPFAEAMARPSVGLGEIARAHLGFAEWLATSDAEPGAERLWRGDAGEAAAAFFTELAEEAGVLPPIAGRDYPTLIDRLVETRVVRPRFGRHPRLHIWGPLEARLQHADVMILGGLNEGSWPPEAAADPWLSRPMRARFGLPAHERRIGLAAHDFAQCAAAPNVVLSRAEKIEGTPTVPSRWLARLGTLVEGWGRTERIAGAPAWLAWHAALDRPEVVRPAPPPAPCPPVDARPRRLSVTAIETWLRDPYAIYAQRILKLRPLDPIDADPGAADRGTIIHEALDHFVSAFDGALPDDALTRLVDFGRAAFERFGDRPGVVAFWWPRFERIADWFIAEERVRRAALQAIASEIVGRLEIAAPAGRFTLTAKADRIERRADGTLAIIDYKTGVVPSTAEVEAGLAPQLSLEAAIAVAGGFEDIAAAAVGELAYWRLTGAEQAGEIKPVKADAMALARDAEAGLRVLIATFDDPATPYLARPDAARAPRFSDYEHLARVKEWSDPARGEET